MKRGSALLVVLGMLAFMVISALAFSAYMRYSRLPSSYLRRSSASRLLAKAALAEAIDEIDAAIGDNPHPGFGNRQPRPGAGSLAADVDGLDNEDLRTRNHWRNHIYLGTNGLLNADSTVATLSLEALAYIPPALVNEARYYSRRSFGGIWRNLGFDSGRYAFCAIDVSDHLNVNALSANVGRGSNPNGRISLACLCEDTQTHKSYKTKPKAWDDFMKNFREVSPAEAAAKGDEVKMSDTKVPLTSIADLNLAIHDKRPGQFTSPFCEYIQQGTSPSFLSGVTDAPDDEKGNLIRNLAFVTDGYFPAERTYSTSEGGNVEPELDLCQDANQPFSKSLLDSCDTIKLRTLIETTEAGQEGGTRLRNHISGLGMAMLYDYLDENNVPVSLAIPSVERTPMITGLWHDFSNIGVKVNVTTDPEGVTAENLKTDGCPGAVLKDEKHRTVTYKKIYKFDGAAFVAGVLGAPLKVTAADPFLRDHGESESIKLDGSIGFFFTNGKMGLRPEDAETLHVKGDGDMPCMETSGLQTDGNGFVLRVPLKSQNITLPQGGSEAEASLLFDSFNSGFQEAKSALIKAFDDNALMTVTWTAEQTATVDEQTGVRTWTGDPSRTEAVCGIRPLTANGALDGTFDGQSLLGLLNAGTAPELTLNAAITLRIKNKNGKTVDLVPAYLDDDERHNGVNNFKTMTGEAKRPGGAYPVMLFRGELFKVSDDESNPDAIIQKPIANAFAKQGVMCLDPRWNWAPEHWFRHDAEINADTWISECHTLFSEGRSPGGGKVMRDRDIFMATSDTGYLQSVYELAFLPRITDLDVSHESEIWGDIGTLADSRPADFPADFASLYANRDLMWRTYCPYDRSNASGGRIESDWFDNVGLVSNGGGYKLNPYCDNTNVMMTAFANTPVDWWAACVNPWVDVGVSESDRTDAERFNRKYAFNEMNTSEKFAWKDLRRIANNFIQAMRRTEAYNPNQDDSYWEDAFDWLDWSGERAHFGNDDAYRDYFGTAPVKSTLPGFDNDQLDSNTVDLWDVDRKFLYGYWRECFAARKQQLFLVFVRAEPLMMGGGSLKQTPPQLGARAVALVWRDPKKGSKSNAPHQTRVLFYRQFE